MSVRVVRERIDPRLTASLFANYRSAGDALLELLDNAIDSRLPDQPLEVDVGVRPGSLSITVTGGSGMGPSEIERDYLRWGASPKRAGERIGRFGQGGKAAIGYLGSRFAIVASPAGDPHAYAFEDGTYRDRSQLRRYELRDRQKQVDAASGYVRIEIGSVDRRVDERRLPARLGEVYRPLLASERLLLRVNRVPVAPADWPLADRHEFSVRAGGRLIRGWWGLLHDPPPVSVTPGIRLYHLGRLVGQPDWFGQPGPALHPALNRLIGEVELPHVPVTTNKSDVDRDSPAWLAVEARLHRLLEPVVRRLAREGVSGATPQALRTAEQARRILARALHLLESGKLFEGGAGSGPGSGNRDQLTLEGYVGRAETPAAAATEAAPQPSQEPKPPPSEAPPVRSGGRGPGSRRGIGEIVIRALDQRLRSAIVVEDGIRKVVINSRYPLYEVRKGDLWYQLETALREVCVAIPEATVPEFERKVNELMLVSLALADRRRRRRPRADRSIPGAWARP